MYSKNIAYSIFFTFIFMNTPVVGASLESSILVKNQLHNFSTIKKNKDLSTAWKLRGSMMIKYINNITLIQKPHLNIYKNEYATNIKSNTAVDPSGDMQEIYLKGNVFINRELGDDNPIKIYTSYAIFYISKNLVETDRDVTIITPDSTTTGSGLSANMDTGIVVVLSNAKRIISKNDELRTIIGNQMIYDSNKEKWTVKDMPANDLKKIISKKVTTTFNTK
tara:strand:+ start:10298 stop:10963 length:666 start_codon:yes stop_codon:yes gene_type:complete